MYDLATPLMQPERLPQFLSTPLFLLYLCLCPEKLLLWTHKYEQRVAMWLLLCVSWERNSKESWIDQALN